MILRAVSVDNHPGQPAHALFYFRDPAYLDRLSEAARPEDFAGEDDTARRKLAGTLGPYAIRHPASASSRNVHMEGSRVLAASSAIRVR